MSSSFIICNADQQEWEKIEKRRKQNRIAQRKHRKAAKQQNYKESSDVEQQRSSDNKSQTPDLEDHSPHETFDYDSAVPEQQSRDTVGKNRSDHAIERSMLQTPFGMLAQSESERPLHGFSLSQTSVSTRYGSPESYMSASIQQPANTFTARHLTDPVVPTTPSLYQHLGTPSSPSLVPASGRYMQRVSFNSQNQSRPAHRFASLPHPTPTDYTRGAELPSIGAGRMKHTSTGHTDLYNTPFAHHASYAVHPHLTTPSGDIQSFAQQHWSTNSMPPLLSTSETAGSSMIRTNSIEQTRDDVLYNMSSVETDAVSIDEQGRSAIHHAARLGRIDLLQACLEGGAHVNMKDYQGWTPLHIATMSGHSDAVHFLLQWGAR